MRSSPQFRFLVKIIACLFSVALLGQFTVQQVGAYNCAGYDPCVGGYSWLGDTMGVTSTVGVVSLYNNDPNPNAFNLNGVWLYSNRNIAGSRCEPYGQCWMEAGINYSPASSSDPTRNALYYYRAETTPGAGYRDVFDMPAVPQNEIGGTMYIDIHKDDNWQNFHLTLCHGQTCEQRSASYDGFDPTRTIFPATRISIGGEMRGSQGGYEPEGQWWFTTWRDSGGNNYYQRISDPPDYPSVNDPPFNAWFDPLPYPYGSDNGGVWHSKCCT